MSDGVAVADWAGKAAARLRASGYREVPATLPERNVRAFRRRDFHIRWFATALHTFVLLDRRPTADAVDVRDLVDETVHWAKKAKGGVPRGLQTGDAVLAVLAVGSADDGARREARRRPDKDFAAIRLPMLVEVEPGVVSTYSGAMVWGMAYTDFLGEQQRLVAGELPVETLGGWRRTAQHALGGRSCAVGALVGLLSLVLVLFYL